MRNLKIAAQVYSVREEAEADFEGTMRELKKMGYDGVEPAGLYGHSAAQIRRWLDEAGLVAPSAHVPFQAFMDDADQTIADYQTIGCKYIGIPSLPMERHYGGEKYAETVEFLRELALRLKATNQVLMYHNHQFEFAKSDKGTYVLDELYAALSPDELETEFDTGWVKAAGVDPVEYLKKYAGRSPVVHMKDFVRNEEGKAELVALGDGVNDIRGIAEQSVRSGADWLVIEQDDHLYGSPMEDMKKSIEYLRSL